MDRIEKLKEFLKKTPDDSFLKYALALEYLKSGEETRALELLNDLLQNDPDYVATYYQLGKFWEGKEQRQQAIQYYVQGLEKAKQQGNRHAASEYQQALDELTD